MKYNYSIFQLKDTVVGKLFFDYEYIVEKYGGIKGDDYNIVYKGEIESENVESALEELYTIFNISHPEDFKGHSLSVSDMVMIRENAYYIEHLYYCDSFGWKQIN